MSSPYKYTSVSFTFPAWCFFTIAIHFRSEGADLLRTYTLPTWRRVCCRQRLLRNRHTFADESIRDRVHVVTRSGSENPRAASATAMPFSEYP